MLDASPQLLFVFSRVRQEITGPKRTFLTRVSREGDPDGPVYHSPQIAHAKQFDSAESARMWHAGQPFEVRLAICGLGFAVTAVAAQPVPMPVVAPAGSTAGLSDADIETMLTTNFLEDTLDGALDDASDTLAAEALGVPVDVFRNALAVADAAGSPAPSNPPIGLADHPDARARRAMLARLTQPDGDTDADRDSRGVEMGGGCPCPACVDLRHARAARAKAAGLASAMESAAVGDQAVS